MLWNIYNDPPVGSMRNATYVPKRQTERRGEVAACYLIAVLPLVLHVACIILICILVERCRPIAVGDIAVVRLAALV